MWLANRWMPMPPQEITISSGSAGGMYQEHAARYQAALASHGIHATVMESAGTGENLKRLKDPASKVHMGFVQGGYAVSEYSQSLSADIETISLVDVEPVWVFSRFKDVDSLLRLQGTRVAIGQTGSGSRAVAVRMLEQVRLEPKDLMLSESVGIETVNALREGRIDAMIFVASPSAPVVQALLKSPNVYLASLRRSAAMIERLPYLEARFVAAGSLSPDTKQPAQDAVLLTTLASVVVREDLHPMIKRILADTALHLHAGAGPLHSAGEFPHLKRVEFSSSAQAREVLRNGLPWIETNFGAFWAQWLYRLLLIGLPLTMIAFLLSRIIPGYLRWLMESSINRWYGELKYIENDLFSSSKPGGLEMARYRGQLRDINEQVSRFEAPRSFMQRMYVLKKHVQFVQTQLQSSHGR
jgi:TRAP-type uncharacterized transport system substrate-binding protein